GRADQPADDRPARRRGRGAGVPERHDHRARESQQAVRVRGRRGEGGLQRKPRSGDGDAEGSGRVDGEGRALGRRRARAARCPRRRIARRRRRDNSREVQDAAAQPGQGRERAAAAVVVRVRRPWHQTVRMNHVYHFLTHWRVEATCGEVADVLGDARDLVRCVRLHTKGWLPYTLRWEFEVVESRYPYGLTLVANGDFEGRGVWTFRQNGRFVEIDYDWRISAEKPLLRSLSFLLKPLFEANHRWAMARGEESLQLELVRRRAVSNAVRAEVPPPPGPVTYAGVVLIAAVVGAAASAAWLIAKAAGRRSGRAGECADPPRTP